MTFDWRKEYERQHGRKPAAIKISDHVFGTAPDPAKLAEVSRKISEIRTNTDAPTATAGAVTQPAPAKASERPAAEATAGGATVNPCGPAEISREQGESGAPTIAEAEILRLADDGCPHVDLARVEIAPNRYVNLSAARKLGLVKAVNG